jgi:carboxyl-terminal processing protease
MDSMPVDIMPDSVAERPIFHTSGGREVYGGGGITPDIIVEYESADTSPSLTQKFMQKRLFFETASKYAKNHSVSKHSFSAYLKSFEVNDQLISDLEQLVIQKDIEFSESDFRANIYYFKARLKAEIARNIWGNEKYYQVLLLYDNQYNRAINLFPRLQELLQVSGSRNIVEIDN